eukprot:gnl/MRDRNA2_/MRDRNA2_251788_c0_seq1.p1 gnl/MRDRNA2_/MRDRNA2_251788_c0~~gnl/MRDRNA2_/MRDRNA2_251788_c0_seq1.p1  ORF type:complete len:143 (+),score=23.35 gnl/MRDRNA2_/MRDRNA2_251788_c0_seq1:59-430(+)
MIGVLKSLPSSPVIILAIPPPLNELTLPEGFCDRICTDPQEKSVHVINRILPDLINRINKVHGLPHPPIDVFGMFGGAESIHSDWFADKCHPNDVGYSHVAAAVRQGICDAAVGKQHLPKVNR